jgi:hypothetical protein
MLSAALERLTCEAKLNSQRKAPPEQSLHHPAAIKQKGALMKRAAVVRNFVAVTFLLASSIVLPVVHADEWNQATLFTLSQSVQIPGQVLPAGTYLFELVNSFNHEIAQFQENPETILDSCGGNGGSAAFQRVGHRVLTLGAFVCSGPISRNI